MVVKIISMFRTVVHFSPLVKRLEHGSSYRGLIYIGMICRETKITSSQREVRDIEGSSNRR